MNRLITMTKYILDKNTAAIPKNKLAKLSDIVKYAEFISQPLELWMFIPCDKQGNTLRHPINPLPSDTKPHIMLLDEWSAANNKVLFKGKFRLINDFFGQGIKQKNMFNFIIRIKSQTIEDIIKYGLELNNEIN